MVLLSVDKYYFLGAAGYETARRATVWNGLVPKRFPEVIVQAHDTDDVVGAIRYARANGYKVGVRSGGHSWAANHLRDGGLLLDVSRLDHCTVDAERMTADVGPGKVANVFAAELDSQGLFFPAGHCEGIRLGGYLLQGGYGWNSKVLGPACESVLGLEVVTADGEQIYCDPENHPDLYWAARGSGTGFFGVVTSFKLRIYRRPAVLGTCLYMYPIELVDEVYTWGREISPQVDDRVELQILATRAYPAAGIDHPAITIASPVFAESEEEAAKALAVLGTCPAANRAMITVPFAPTNLAGWYTAVMTNYPKGHRYIADNMFTSASAEELLPGIRRIIETMPPHPSHFIFTGWGTSEHRTDKVYGLEDEIYMALYTVWQSAADDERYRDWAASNMAAMSHLATGIALADENLGRRQAKFITDPNMARLERCAQPTTRTDASTAGWDGDENGRAPATDPDHRCRGGRHCHRTGVAARWPRRHRLRTAAGYATRWRCGDHLVQRLDGSGAAGRRHGRGGSAAVHRADRDIDRSHTGQCRPDHDRGTAWRIRSDGATSDVLLDRLLQGFPAERIRCNSRAVGAVSTRDGVRIEFEDGSSAEGDLLIGADGLHSKVREYRRCEHPRSRPAGAAGRD